MLEHTFSRSVCLGLEHAPDQDSDTKMTESLTTGCGLSIGSAGRLPVTGDALVTILRPGIKKLIYVLLRPHSWPCCGCVITMCDHDGRVAVALSGCFGGVLVVEGRFQGLPLSLAASDTGEYRKQTVGVASDTAVDGDRQAPGSTSDISRRSPEESPPGSAGSIAGGRRGPGGLVTVVPARFAALYRSVKFSGR